MEDVLLAAEFLETIAAPGRRWLCILRSSLLWAEELNSGPGTQNFSSLKSERSI